MQIWIDADTGTWGSNVDRLMLVDLSEDQVEALDEKTDTEIMDIAAEHGIPLA